MMLLQISMCGGSRRDCDRSKNLSHSTNVKISNVQFQVVNQGFSQVLGEPIDKNCTSFTVLFSLVKMSSTVEYFSIGKLQFLWEVRKRKESRFDKMDGRR